MNNLTYKNLIITVLVINFTFLFADQTINPDELFREAREHAFSDKREKAIKLCKEILIEYPEYYDVRAFLGRVYAWEENFEQAKKEVNQVLSEDRDNKAAFYTAVDIQYWSNNYQKSLDYIEQGQNYYPTDEFLLYKKALILDKLNKNDEAVSTLNSLLKINPSHKEGLKLYDTWQSSRKNYQAKILYRYHTIEPTEKKWNFGNINSELTPWQFISTELSRRMTFGKVIGRINYAYRFEQEGLQYEIESYPQIRDNTYSYLNLGYSNSNILPRFRFGAEIYQMLPINFEGSLGWRYIDYDSPEVNIFTLSLGKYYRDYWINIRAYLSPQDVSISNSYFLNIRRYLFNSDNYALLMFGYGASPDEELDQNQVDYLGSKKFTVGAHHSLKRNIALEWRLNLENNKLGQNNYRKNSSVELSLFYDF